MMIDDEPIEDKRNAVEFGGAQINQNNMYGREGKQQKERNERTTRAKTIRQPTAAQRDPSIGNFRTCLNNPFQTTPKFMNVCIVLIDVQLDG
jgi:hypothetical protein